MAAVAASDLTVAPARGGGPSPALAFLRGHPTVVLGLALLGGVALVALLAPWLHTVDPVTFSPVSRLKPPSERFWFGTDGFGRDVYSRTLYGGRISLLVGFGVALASTAVGLTIGLVAGYVRTADAVLMRVMDGLMAIPAILLAIALIAVTQASVQAVLIAITIPEIQRVVRLVRGIVLTLTEAAVVGAGTAIGNRV